MALGGGSPAQRSSISRSSVVSGTAIRSDQTCPSQPGATAAAAMVPEGTAGTYAAAAFAGTPSADANTPVTQRLIECDEAVAVGYLDSIKVQFDVQGLVLVRGVGGSAISARLPRELFRFQRRNSFRVRPLLRSSPVARVRHPVIAEMQLALRVIDVSIGGCALFLPEDVPAMQPGMVMNQVQIDLDADTRIVANVRLQHASVLNPEAKGARLGCEFVQLGKDAERALQRFIDQTQKRRRLMSLD